MNYRPVMLLLFLLAIVHNALADSRELTDDQLMANFDSAVDKAKIGIKEYDSNIQSPILPSPTATPDTRKTDQIIDDLMKQVDDLQSKVVVTKKTSLATQTPRRAKVLGSKTTYSFNDNDIYEIRAGIDRITDIELQPEEILINAPVAGDTVRWKTSILQGKRDGKEITHIIIKPLDIDIETNLLLTTNRRTYHLKLTASDWYMPSVSWNYPQDEELETQAREIATRRSESVNISPESLNFGYEVEDRDFSWTPIRVFDDGSKTYFQMSPDVHNREAPALFILENDEVLLTNYRVKGEFYIVDRLLNHAQLRIGAKQIVNVWAKGSRPSLVERIFW